MFFDELNAIIEICRRNDLSEYLTYKVLNIFYQRREKDRLEGWKFEFLLRITIDKHSQRSFKCVDGFLRYLHGCINNTLEENNDIKRILNK